MVVGMDKTRLIMSGCVSLGPPKSQNSWDIKDTYVRRDLL